MGFHGGHFAAIVFLSSSIVGQNFSELLVLRYPTTDNKSQRNLTCMSEDDGSALIWNNNISVNSAGFLPKIPTSKNVSECAIWNTTSCHTQWGNMSGWEVVDSADKPMGPVFDYRWEDFDDLYFTEKVENQDYRYVNKALNFSGNAVFSVRGIKDVHIFLCEKSNATNGLCFWIIIGGWEDEKSVIRSCPEGAPRGNQQTYPHRCTSNKELDTKDILDEYEWRTFRLAWIGSNDTIQVFKNTDHEPFLESKVNNSRAVPYMFARCHTGTHLRFHYYKYFLTEITDSMLYTEEFYHYDENFCIELLSGLCPECELIVSLTHENNRSREIGVISGNKNSVYNGMLSWRSDKLNATLGEFRSKLVRLQIRTTLAGNKGKGRWAIDKLRMCKPVGQLRESNATTNPDSPKIVCQKLSYAKSILFDSLSSVTIPSNTTESRKFVDELVESCGSACEIYGKKWSLCNSIGCTCSRGFTARNCNEECTDDRYGYNCRDTCGSCNTVSCDKITGYCVKGCNSNSSLPPLCRTEIKKPDVVNITDTTALARQELQLEADVEATLDVAIQVKFGESWKNLTTNLSGTGVPSTYEARILGLNVGTNHTIRTFVSVKLPTHGIIPVTGPEKSFETTCFGNPSFDVTPSDHNLTVNIENNPGCKNDQGPHYLVLIYNSSEVIIRNHSNPRFPANYTNLTAYTEYKVQVSYTINNATLFTDNVRTLESAPPAVENLTSKSSNETAISLEWEPPSPANGIIRNYSVSLTMENFIACGAPEKSEHHRNATLQTVNETTVTFTGLRPYVNYTATVVARTIESGDSKTIIVQTPQSDVPTSKISNFRLADKNLRLKWDEPTDCTTITGPANTTRLIFASVDDSVKNSTRVKQTKNSYYDLTDAKLELLPYTLYRVRAYVIRGYDLPENSTSYQELRWRTPPIAPPAVKDLETYDADPSTNTTSLRWIPPSPANGVIESYRVSIKTGEKLISNKTLSVSDGLQCDLWKNYACLEGLIIPPATLDSNSQIEVFAMNEEVREPGAPSTVPIESAIYNTEPSEPENFTSIPAGHGIVTLQWMLPTLTRTRIARFYIHARYLSTDLQSHKTAESPMTVNHLAKPNQTKYSADLYLSTATVYDVSIVASNHRNKNSTEIKMKISVPRSVAFASGEKPQVKQSGRSILVKPPAVVNATRNTTVSVYVKGLTTCAEIDSPTFPSPYKTMEWLAAVYKHEENKPNNFTIGADHHHGVSSNCSLDIGETYRIVLVVTDGNSGTSDNVTSPLITLIVEEPYHKPNLAWLVILVILVVCLSVVVLFVRYRKRRISSQPGRPEPKTDSPVVLWNKLQPSRPSPDIKHKRVSPQQAAPDVVPYNPHSYPVEIDEFEEYTKEALASGLLESQYGMLTRGLTKPCKYGKLPENKSKNRYKDLTAYDDTRVILKKIPGDPHSDYINATYIPGYKNERAYIATQGPKRNTVNDFWRMLWQEEVRVICMLANVIEGGKLKCEQYWPEVGCETKYGKMFVSTTSNQVFVDYTVRTFALTFSKISREITHLHYTGWPDHGVPMYTQSLLPYLKKLLEIPTGNGPVVVHCSAGVGRTGTIILCDTCLRRAKEESVVDLPGVMLTMRNRRANMVDNVQQYLFAHLVIVECTVSEHTEIPCDDLLQDRIKELRKQLPFHVKRLNDAVWQDRALHSLAAPRLQILEDVTATDVDSNLAPFRSSPTFDVRSRYITTVGVDGMKMKNQYLASRLPSPANRADLWRRIADENVELVIILQRPDPDEPTCCDIIPSELTPVVPATCDEDDEHMTINKIVLTGEEARPQPVTVLTCTGWERGREGKPPPADALVSLWRASEKISRQESPTFVLCHDGVTGCGLYLALSFLLERMALERECDVISAVRAVRRFKPEFVRSLEQFEYLYDAAVKYNKCFETYANFS